MKNTEIIWGGFSKSGEMIIQIRVIPTGKTYVLAGEKAKSYMLKHTKLLMSS